MKQNLKSELRKCRVVEGLSIEALAKKFGVVKSTAYEWTKDLARPHKLTPTGRWEGKKKPRRQKTATKYRMRNGPYILILAPPEYPGKKYRDRFAYEHHVVYWQNTKKAIPAGMVIHHKNHDKHDNRFSNLELLTNGAHASHHHKKPWAYVFHGCFSCGKSFRLSGSDYRYRKKNSASGRLFCSKHCQISRQQIDRWS